PDTLTWETSSVTTNNRAHWLVIDKLGPQPSDSKTMTDLSAMAEDPAYDFGARSIGTRITRVMPGSNAEKMGIKAGDVLSHVTDETIHAGVDVQEALEDVKPGAHIELLLARNTLPVELSGPYEPQTIQPPPKLLFARSAPSGRVDLTRAG